MDTSLLSESEKTYLASLQDPYGTNSLLEPYVSSGGRDPAQVARITQRSVGSATVNNMLTYAVSAFNEKQRILESKNKAILDQTVNESRTPGIVTQIQTTPVLITVAVLAGAGLLLLRAIR